VRATGFEPATVGFGVQRSTVGATPSPDDIFQVNSNKNVKILMFDHIYLFIFVFTIKLF
jgi:hypothetical protein